MKPLASLTVAAMLAVTSSVSAQRTADIEGAKDYPTISRFNGAVIEFYQETKWGTYRLPVSDQGTVDWDRPMSLEGKVIRIQYSVSHENNSEFVLQNYKAALLRSGYEVLIAIANEALGDSDRPHTWIDRYYATGGYYNGLNNQKFGLGLNFPTWKNDHSFIAARGRENGKDIYVIVYTVVADAFTIITQDVVEVEAVETGLVSVDNISSDITKNGHIAIYGIHFETGKSVLKAESDAALKTIAEYVNAHSDKKFFIVGHTDNTGDFQANMTLSEERAKSVMTALITTYAVNAGQVSAYGVASLAPAASNLSDEGRAKNRRVEIVEQ
ncbi:OmpA family protein [bacterium]|nr:OmpA family protein [bacterium]